MSEAASKEKESIDKRLKRIQANPGATPTVSDMMVGDMCHAPSVNSDLQFDLRSKQGASELTTTKEKDLEVKVTRKIIKQIEAETGLGDIDAIIDKAEKHAESFSTMNELSKTLQTKMLNLYQKKDQMQKQIDGLSFDPSKLRSKKSVQDLNERNSKQEEFDLQERKLTALQEQLEVLKEDKVKEERLNAQLGYGISALADRLGIEHQPSESIYIKMKKCNAKIKQL